jgi:hypothetical protein
MSQSLVLGYLPNEKLIRGRCFEGSGLEETELAGQRLL